ncbi:aminotransferase class IV family protein [Actinomadura rudentiformis]|uniref:Aminotransferase class IV family protein n=1 Tax=Actinomadura rudentiformis TaxID=359158 RepID=A0A6H9YWF9_9ACTN|nr:aminotransferase class IV family protein [Actinomadura rudentiformis]KAB2345208.1 aminotransferase class IV family protein [Actinomadura rudentiformis]
MSLDTQASYAVHRNGGPATAEDLAPLAFAGYAHFTAMQVRGGQVRGLDLHLERLRTASMEMFGEALPDDQVRSYLKSALADGPADLSLTATVYSSAGEFTTAVRELQVLVRTAPPASGPEGPLSLAMVEHERNLPAVKHVGEVAKTYYLRQAGQQGFDDAAFVDRRGRLSEATIWNLAFWDGATVVWPVAEMLRGVTMGIVRRRLRRMGVPQRDQEITFTDLPSLTGAVVMNSWTPGVPVHRVGAVPLPEARSFVELLHKAYQAEPLTSP